MAPCAPLATSLISVFGRRFIAQNIMVNFFRNRVFIVVHSQLSHKVLKTVAQYDLAT